MTIDNEERCPMVQMIETAEDHDVIVVGGGNAALCAAISACEEGARVLLLERAPEEERGGNSAFSEGLMRLVYDTKDDIVALSPDDLASDFGSYTDMARVTRNRTDPDLCEILVKQSNATLHWLRQQGVRFLPQFRRQAFRRIDAMHYVMASSPSGAARRLLQSVAAVASSTSCTAVPGKLA